MLAAPKVRRLIYRRIIDLCESGEIYTYPVATNQLELEWFMLSGYLCRITGLCTNSGYPRDVYFQLIRFPDMTEHNFHWDGNQLWSTPAVYTDSSIFPVVSGTPVMRGI